MKFMTDPQIDGRKALIRRFYDELWNRWDYSVIAEIITEDVAFHGSLDVDATGHDGFVAYAETIRGAFPDFENRVEDMIGEGNRVAACLTYSGTHEGSVMGIEATGRRIQYAGVGIFVFREELISDVWVLGDRLALLRQLTEPEND